MIKLSANLSKKVPIAGVRFSSEQFGASVEIECGDAAKPEVLQARIRALYQMLSESIDEQIQAHASKKAEDKPKQQAVSGAEASNGSGNGRSQDRASNGQGAPKATQAQQRAIFAICKSLDLDQAEVLADYNVAESAELHIKDASRLIDELKAKQNGNGASKRR